MRREAPGEVAVVLTLAEGVMARQMCEYALQQARRNGERVLPAFHELVAGLKAATADGPAPVVAADGRRSSDVPSECVVTVATAAGLLGRSDRTVLRWLQDGRLKGERLGRVWVVDSRSIDEHLEEIHAA